MASPRVLITSYFVMPEGEEDRLLRGAGFETVFNHWHGGRTEEEMIGLLEGVNGAIVSVDPLTERVLKSAPQLKVLSRTGVGYDAIDVKAATDLGIRVCITPGANHEAVADWTLCLILQCARKIVQNLDEVPHKRWILHEGHDLCRSTLGIVGLGAIGKAVAKRARAFGTRVIAYDLYQDEAFARENQVEYVPLEQLLRESDFISLHLFLNDATYHLINAERLAMMKPTAHLINTSRGGTVDSDALYQALKEKRIAGAALDVFEIEPPVDSPLLELDNVYLSSHVAGATAEARRNMGVIAAENVIQVLRGERPAGLVNPNVMANPI